MKYTKGEWEVYEGIAAPAVVVKGKPNRPDHVVAICRLEGGSEGITEALANARLIVAAVNACASVNPDNPMAVAQSVKAMYEALKMIDKWVKIKDGTIYQAMKQALAKAERKGE